MEDTVGKMVMGLFLGMAAGAVLVAGLAPAGMLTAGFMAGSVTIAGVMGAAYALNPHIIGDTINAFKGLVSLFKGKHKHHAPAQEPTAATAPAQPQPALENQPAHEAQPKLEKPQEYISMGEVSTYHRDQVTASRAALVNFDHTRAPRC